MEAAAAENFQEEEAAAEKVQEEEAAAAEKVQDETAAAVTIVFSQVDCPPVGGVGTPISISYYDASEFAVWGEMSAPQLKPTDFAVVVEVTVYDADISVEYF